MGLFTYTFFKIYYSIQYRILTHTLHINISYSSVWLSAFVIMWHMVKKIKRNHMFKKVGRW